MSALNMNAARSILIGLGLLFVHAPMGTHLQPLNETDSTGCNGNVDGIPCCKDGFILGDNDDQEMFIQTGDYNISCLNSCKSLYKDSIGITESVKQKYSSGNGKNKNKCWCEFGDVKLDATKQNYQTCVFDVPTCSSGAITLSTSPRQDMVLCKDETEQTCEKDFESLCPARWNLCTPGQFNNRNDGWNYNWVQAGAGTPIGVIYCVGGRTGYAQHYGIYSNSVLNTDQQRNCWVSSSRPGCEAFAGCCDCDDKYKSALCCAPSTTCGDGLVQEEEDCDDGNEDNMDECLNTCTWKTPKNHGHSGSWC